MLIAAGVLLLLCICLVTLGGIFAAGVRRASAQAAPAISTGRQQAIRCAAPSPFARRNFFFSAAERSFYEILRRLNPGYTVFAKVRLCDLVRVQASGREFWEKFNSISSKHVDFVVCDEQLAPLLAIELDDLSHGGPRRIKRDRFVDSVFESAALPILHVSAKRGYVLEEIRQLLAPHLPVSSANVTEPAEFKYLPRGGWRPSA